MRKEVGSWEILLAPGIYDVQVVVPGFYPQIYTVAAIDTDAVRLLAAVFEGQPRIERYALATVSLAPSDICDAFDLTWVRALNPFGIQAPMEHPELHLAVLDEKCEATVSGLVEGPYLFVVFGLMSRPGPLATTSEPRVVAQRVVEVTDGAGPTVVSFGVAR